MTLTGGFKTDLIAGTLTAHTGMSTLCVKTRKTASETNFSVGLKRGCRYPSRGWMAGVKRVAPGLSEVKGVGYLGIFPWLPTCQLARSRGVTVIASNGCKKGWARENLP